MKKSSFFISALFIGAAAFVAMTSYVNHPSIVCVNPTSQMSQGEPMHITLTAMLAEHLLLMEQLLLPEPGEWR